MLIQRAVLATIYSVCLTVRLSITVWYHVKMTQVTIMQSSLEDSPVTSFCAVTLTAKFQREQGAGR